MADLFLQGIEKLQNRIKSRLKKNRDDEDEIFKLKAKQHKAKIAELVGKPNAVRRRFRAEFNPELNDALGTVLEVRRTQCTVEFGDLGPWTVPIKNVIPAGDKQGMFIGFGRRSNA